MTKVHYETAESVLGGHPDKLCDYLADCVLDACLAVDSTARVACEVMATQGRIIVAGEIACQERINICQIIRQGLMDRDIAPETIIFKCISNPSQKILPKQLSVGKH